MTEFTNRYYPTVSLRRGEMRAFEKLPESEKQKTLPVVLLAPWLNSIKFANTFRIIEKSIGDQPIVVDLDRYYQSDSPLESRAYFWSLLQPSEGPAKWMKLVEEHPNYIPCIQHLNVAAEIVETQVEWAQSLGRGFCFRFESDRHQDLRNYVLSHLKHIDDNTLVIIDFGYSDYSESLRLELNDLLEQLFDFSSELRVVLTGSNFPNDFSDFDNFASSHQIASRALYSELKTQFGNYNLFYGDWASTKPRAYDGRGSAPLPRIDYPTASAWIIPRSKDEQWSLEDASLRITRLPEWADRPKVWGTGMIEKTALGRPGGITTHPEAIAVRINIHLFIQANYGAPTVPNQPKGRWKDPI
mgnify:FL=1